MNIIIFGGTGRTGVEFVSQALAERHRVTVFARSQDKLNHLFSTQRSVVGHIGDIGDPAQVASAMRGHDVVVSALGVSKPLHHDPMVIRGVQNILHAMHNTGVPRLVYLSAFLVFRHEHRFGFFVSNVLRRILRNELRDHEVKETLIRDAGVEHVMVRATRLTAEPLTGTYEHGEQVRLSQFLPSIGRADTAHFMLRQVGATPYLNRAPIVSRR